MSSALLKTLEEAVSSLVTASGTEPPSSSLPTLLAQANRAETFAREGALFSRNESVDDLSTLALRFLPVPFYQYVIESKAMEREMEGRLDLLLSWREKIGSFLSFAESYGLASQSELDVVSNPQLMNDASKRREVVIARAKKDKQLREEMAAAVFRRDQRRRARGEGEEEDDDEDEDDRLIALTWAKYMVVKALDALRVLDQEADMLQQIAKMARDNPKELDDARMARRAFQEDFSTKVREALASLPPVANDRDRRREIQEAVFRPGHRLPTVTIEEFAQQEVEQAMERDRKSKEAQAQKAQVDSEDEAEIDKKTYKARQWDEFRDNNPKGAGNTGVPTKRHNPNEWFYRGEI